MQKTVFISYSHDDDAHKQWVRKFRTEYKSKNLHGFCKEQKVSYTKMLHCLRNYIKSQLHRDPTNGDIFIIFAS